MCNDWEGWEVTACSEGGSDFEKVIDRDRRITRND